MATATRTRPRGLTRPPLNVHPLPPSLEALCPEVVLNASRALAEAERNRAAAVSTADAARQAVEQARAADTQAAQGAARDGGKLPTPTEGKAQAKADEASRAVEAHRATERAAKEALVAVVRQHRDALAAAAEGQLGELAAASREHLDAVEQALTRRREVGVLLKALDPNALEGREATFQPAVRSRRERDPLPVEQRALLTELRESLGA